MIQSLVHYSLHFLFPGIIALVFFPNQWKRAWLIMLATMFIDLDHLLADPIFDPQRCSINMHPLHTYWVTIIYIAFLFFKRTRILGVGLVLHILTDGLDCRWNLAKFVT